MTNPIFYTASQACAKIYDRSLTVEAYAKSLLSYISIRDVTVNAWAYVNTDQVLEHARELDLLPRERRGPLHGIPVGVKDVLLTKDMPTQYNSPIYEDDEPKVDAAVVKMLRSAGALLIGMHRATTFWQRLLIDVP